MTAIALRDHIVSALEDLKGQDILALDVTQLTPITDFMVLASGTSNPVSYTHLTLPTTPYV